MSSLAAIKTQMLANFFPCPLFRLSLCSPGRLLWGYTVFWGAQVVGHFFLAALRLCATTRLLPPPDWTTVAVAVFSPSQLSPTA